MLVLESCFCGFISLKDGTRILSSINTAIACLGMFSIVRTCAPTFWAQLYVIFCIYQIGASFLAIYGVALSTERPSPSFMLPLLTLLIFLLVVPPILIAMVNLSTFSNTLIVITEIALVILEVFISYSILVVYSFYKQLERRTEPQPQSSPRPT